MKKTLKAAALLGGAAALTTAIGAWCGYHTAFRADPRRQSPIQEIPEGEGFDDYREQMLENINILLETPYERVTVRSHDGLKLVGKFYEGQPGAPLILFFHGYRSTAERDGSGGFQLCREKGWHILMPDQRAHGESEGDTITFGIRERLDCLAWARYAARRMGPDTPIFLWGISMGAATVLMASDLPMPETVRGIVADCGYDTPAGILKETIRHRRWPMFPLYPFTVLGARWFGKFSVTETSAPSSTRRPCRASTAPGARNANERTVSDVRTAVTSATFAPSCGSCCQRHPFRTSVTVNAAVRRSKATRREALERTRSVAAAGSPPYAARKNKTPTVHAVSR